MRLTARATRTDKWWSVEVPEITGLFTQARRLDQVPGMVADAASLLTGESASGFEVEVLTLLQEDDPDHAALDQLRTDQKKLHELSNTVQQEAAGLASALHHKGITYRELGLILGVSHQRAHQLVAAAQHARN